MLFKIVILLSSCPVLNLKTMFSIAVKYDSIIMFELKALENSKNKRSPGLIALPQREVKLKKTPEFPDIKKMIATPFCHSL